MPFILGVDWEECCECHAPAPWDGGRRLWGPFHFCYSCDMRLMKGLEKYKPEKEEKKDAV